MPFKRKNDPDLCELTILLTALGFESNLIVSLLKDKKLIKLPSVCATVGYLGKEKICVTHSGVGSACCKRALCVLLDEFRSSRVVLMGTAGALSPEVVVGDVIIANSMVFWKAWQEAKSDLIHFYGAKYRHSNKAKTSSIRKLAFNIHKGTVVTFDEPLFDKELKSRLYQLTNAQCVDMETGYVAQICEERRVPFLVIKGISDNAEDDEEKNTVINLSQALLHASLIAIEFMSNRESEEFLIDRRITACS